MRAHSPASRHVAATLLAILLLLLPAAARALSDQRAVLSLMINTAGKDDTTVVLRGGEVWIPVSDLIAAGLRDFPGRREVLFGASHVLLSSLAPLVQYTLDEEGLALRLTVPAGALPPSLLDLSPGTPKGIIRRHDPSAFLNYALRLTDFRHPDGAAEAVVSWESALLSTTVTASEGGVIRGLSSLAIDDPTLLARFTGGDAFISGGPLGAGLITGGLTISKSFELDPYFLQQPSFNQSGSAATPSTLDVYVNGVLVRRQAVPPGPFRLQNLPVSTGSGEVRYVLRDAFGRQESVSSPYYVASGLLAKGLSDYAYSFGAQRNQVGAASFNYGALGFLGRHRMGITDSLTLGARFEASGQLVSGGATATVLTPAGRFELAAAASDAVEGAGVAGLGAWSFVSRHLGASLSVRAASDRYSTLSTSATADRSLFEVAASTSTSLGSRGSLSMQYAFALDRDNGPTFRASASASVQITKRLSAVMLVGRSFLTDGSAPVDALLSLTFAPGNNAPTLSAGVQSQAKHVEGFAEASKPLGRENDFGYRVAGSLSEQPRAQASGQYQSSYGLYGVTAEIAPGQPHLALEAAGAIAAVAGAGAFVTRPIQSGFAVIRVPGIKGVRGYLDNQEVGRTNRDGNLLVPTLLPYYGNRLSIDEHDLPLDYGIPLTEQMIAPTHRGGAVALFSVARVHFYRGTLTVKGAKNPIPSLGELSVRMGKKVVASPIARDGSFELEGVDPGDHPSTIIYQDGECAFTLHVPESQEHIVNLGRVQCDR
jgi:outer membrane usher protein